MDQEQFEEGAVYRPKKNNGSIWLKVLIVILSVVLVALIALAVGMEYLFGRLGNLDDSGGSDVLTDEFDTDSTLGGDQTLATIDASDVVFEDVAVLEGDVINIMLIGEDRPDGNERGRSDSMILITLNRAKNAIQLTSFMRDTYVKIPGYADNRLNVAYRYGGTELMNETFRKNFGLEIDGNVMVDFDEFSNIIDILGGVDMELTETEAKYMRNKGHKNITAGVNHLDGAETLTFARMRKVSGDDYGRTERQRQVLTALVESFRDADLTVIGGLIQEVLPHVATNLSNGAIIQCVTEGFGILADGGELQSTRIPANDAHYSASIRNMSVLVPDLPECREDLWNFIYATDEQE